MVLDNELISELVKQLTKTEPQSKQDNKLFATVVNYNGEDYVRLDGSDVFTPVISTIQIKEDDRVLVDIKGHTAFVVGNITDPAASGTKVDNVSNQITEFEIVIADKVNADELNAQIGRIDQLVSDNVIIRDSLTASSADIADLKAENVTISGKLTAAEAEIDKLDASKITAEQADLKYATIENLNATNADIFDLNATYGDFVILTTERFEAAEARIGELDVDKLSVKDADIKYANIDFSNIDKATMEYFYAQSGLIDNVVIGDGTITGELVGVTIRGDLIQAETLIADKIIFQGEDGLYYKMNTDGVTVEEDQTLYNSLDGSIIIANSITASKINVDDLIAFDATIGGFNIGKTSIYSGVKESIENTTRGIYMDVDGQMNFGDSNNYVKYYKDQNGNYKLEITADSILFGTSKKNVESLATTEEVHNVQNIADTAQGKAETNDARVTIAESLIQQLNECIAMLVTDGDGASLMTQTENGWTFGMGAITDLLNEVSNGLNDLTNEVGDTNNAVDVLNQAVSDLGVLANYVRITTDGDQPCIELGTGNSNFKLLITNTDIRFMEGSSVIAYINNQTLHITKAIINEELQQGEFVWKVRSNGNLGLQWKGGGNG